MRSSCRFLVLLAFAVGGCSRRQAPPVVTLTNVIQISTNPLLTFTNAKPAATNAAGPTAPGAPAAPSVGKDLALGKIGVLHLEVPAGWHDQIAKIPEADKLFEGVIFRPTAGNDFEAFIEVIYVGASNMAKLDLHAMLQAGSRTELTNSVETNLDVQDFQGEQGSGSYFVVTDATFSALEPPIRGNYRFKLQGYAKLNGVVLTIKLVSNHIAVEQPAFLEMIKTARFTRSVPEARPPP